MNFKRETSGGNRKHDRVHEPRTPEEWELWRKRKREKKDRKTEAKILRKAEKEKKREEKEQLEKERLEQEEKKKNGRQYTVSIALPGSILDNAQTPELRTYLAGQIARAAVIFNVDEIVIFDEGASTERSTEGVFEGVGKKGRANVQLARVLQYLECPQYLRKAFFPQHKDLQYAGLLNPLDCPHHMRIHDESVYREGVTLDKPVKPDMGSFVNVGLKNAVQVDKHLQPGVRVTVKLDADQDPTQKKLKGIVVPPSAPRTDANIYWGYTVRIAKSLGAVFTESPYSYGYDRIIGTSDKGDSVDKIKIPEFQHLLVVFGGLKGLEASLEADEELNIDDPRFVFQHYVNSCPDQGSRTIRTEEAILITLAALRTNISQTMQPDDDESNDT